MPRPEFIPSAPKESASITLEVLKRCVAAGDKVEGAKTVGSGVVKLFMSGTLNYYISDGADLRTYLYYTFKVEP